MRDYVHVNDIIEIVKICLNKKNSNIFNFATGKSYKISKIINLIEKKINKKSKLDKIKTGHKQFDMIFNINNFKKIFPKFKITHLSSGLDSLIKLTKP